MTPEELPNCYECNEGRYHEVQKDYHSLGSGGEQCVVPNVKFWVCSACQDELITEEGLQKITEFTREANERLSPDELKDAREKYEQNLKDMSEILGLGEKTYGRWEKGIQFPNRSMGYYIRVLAEFPEAFEWLKNKGWKNKTNASNRPLEILGEENFYQCFPDLAQKRASAGFSNDNEETVRAESLPTEIFNNITVQ